MRGTHFYMLSEPLLPKLMLGLPKTHVLGSDAYSGRNVKGRLEIYLTLLENSSRLLYINEFSSSSNKAWKYEGISFLYIGLTSIRVNGKPIKFDGRILSVDRNGRGGTKLSTITPYTVLHSKIYRAFTEAFVKESAALNLTVTEPVEPFRICYEAEDVLSTRTGPGVPTVDLVLQGEDVIWRIFGENSMVRIFRGDDNVDVWCLGVLDGGSKPKTSIVIGGHQMEDNLLHFDLKSKRLGFSSSVSIHGTRCVLTLILR